MLKTLRGSIKGVVSWIIVGLFILAFAFVGVPALDNFSAGSGVTVGQQRFGIGEVEDEFRRSIERYRNQTGEVLSQEEAVQAGLLNEVLNVMTIRGLYKEEARRLGLTVTDEMIQTSIRTDENLFNPETNRFDTDYFRRILSSNGISIVDFRERVSEDLLRQQINNAIGLPLTASETFSGYLALRQSEERLVQTVEITPDSLPDPSEEDLQLYYEDHITEYQTPDRRTYTMVLLNEDTLADLTQISEDDLRQAYAAREDSLGTPERRTFVQAQFSSSDAAQAALAKIRAGQSIEQVADEAGVATLTFDLEPKSAIADTNVANAIFATEEQGLVGPIENVFGSLIADVRAIEPGTEVTFEDVRTELEQGLKAEIYAAELDRLYDELQDMGDTGMRLSEAAAEVGLPVQTVGPADENMMTTEGAIEDVPVAAHQMAFRQNPGALFQVVDLNDGAYAFVELEQVLPGAPKPFADVADEVKADYIAQETETALQNAVDEFKLLVADKDDFTAAALAMNLAPTTEQVTATSIPQGMPQSLFQSIFETDIGALTTASAPDRDAMIVAQVDEVSFGPNGQASTMTEMLSVQYGQRLSAEYQNAYINAAREAFKVKRNDAQIQARFGVE